MTKDFIIGVGKLPRGTRNAITDVAGVRVGHATVDHGDAHTGVTVIVPCEGNVYARKPVAAAHVLNGFGKTCGLVQLEELGCLETPIALTNTLCVGRVADALVTHALREAERDGLDLPGTINPVVGETNDGRINNIRARSVGGRNVLDAIDAAGTDFRPRSSRSRPRHGLLWAQGRNRKLFSSDRDRWGDVHAGRARTEQLRAHARPRGLR